MPLFVDLDGTLIRTDLLYESFLDRLKHDWILPGRVLSWLTRGKAYMKAQLARGYRVPTESLPYNEAVIDRVQAARKQGRRVYLATASHVSLAEAIGAHLGMFDGVIASDQRVNVSGSEKLERLREVTGSDRFEYMGNSGSDIPIWEACAIADVVEPDRAARRWVADHAHKARVLAGTANRAEAVGTGTGAPSAPRSTARSTAWRDRLRILRPHQWLKNLLLFVPLVTAHLALDPRSVLLTLMAFVAFSLCASAVYVINDMLDLNADRVHPRKRHRPFASGAVPLSFGFKAAPLLMLGAGLVAALVSPLFVGALGLYLVMTFAYSFSLKRKMAIDVLMLAGLYTMRIIAGTAAIGVAPSNWLMGFSTFLFFGLALVKRSSELMVAADSGKSGASGRNYLVADLLMVNSMGIASSYLSVLVLALYINSAEVRTLYAHPYGLWLLCPLLLYWLTRLWLITQRGGMHDDPVIYAARDRVSQLVALCGLGVVLASSLPWVS